MTCDAFLEQIKSDFDYLFGEYGFRVLLTDVAATRDDYCLVILESTSCRLKFDRSYEATAVKVGTISAPLTWEDGWQEGTFDESCWFGIQWVLHFVSNTEPNLEQLLEWREFRPVSQQLKEIAEKLRPLCPKVMLLFQPENIRKKESGFADFVQWRQYVGRKTNEKIQKRYSFARK